jgi:hypothetical protein
MACSTQGKREMNIRFFSEEPEGKKTSEKLGST